MKGRTAPTHELLLVTLGLALIGIGSVVLTGSTLFSGPLWLDEYHSVLVATLPTVSESLKALSLGADFNPPLLHLLLKPLALDGAISPLELRLFSILSVDLALLALYRLLRHDFAPLPCVAGILIVWGHPEVMHQAFEGRYYGPMLLFSALLALSIRNRSLGWAGRTMVAAFSVALCTIHYFGIFAWVLLIGSAVWVQWERGAFWRLWPSLAGPVALLLCTPFYLGQKEALTVSTWVENPSVQQVWNLFGTYFAWLPACAILFLGVVRLLTNTALREDGTESRARASWTLISLAAYPIVLVAFSILIQPSIVTRYAVVTTLALAPVVAIVMEREGKWTQVVIVLLLLMVGARELRAEGHRASAFGADSRSRAAAILETVPELAELVVPSRHDLYPLAAELGHGGPRLVFPFLPMEAVQRVYTDASDEEWVRSILLEQDVAAIHGSLFGFPNVEDQAVLSKRDTLFLAIWEPRYEVDRYAADFFPAFQIEPVRQNLVRLVRR